MRFNVPWGGLYFQGQSFWAWTLLGIGTRRVGAGVPGCLGWDGLGAGGWGFGGKWLVGRGLRFLYFLEGGGNFGYADLLRSGFSERTADLRRFWGFGGFISFSYI